MRSKTLLGAVVGAMCFTGAIHPALGQSRVELVVVTEAGSSVTAPHEWMTALKGLGLGRLQIRSARPGDRPGIERVGAGQSPRYRVTAVVTARNELRVPGGRFAMRDMARFANWLSRLEAGGVEGLGAKPAAFGLSARQLVEVHQKLALPVAFSTRGASPKNVVRKIAAAVEPHLAVDPAVGKMFDEDWTVTEELSGVSSGTVLAAVLRPLGLILVPKDAGGKVQLLVTDARSAPESWPVGWPAEEKLSKLAPGLFKFLTVEIAETPLADVLDALGKRIEMPILLDHNSLARHRIDPSQVKVSFPSRRTYYKRVLDTVLYKARLKSEVRVDEAGKPLVWVSTLKP